MNNHDGATHLNFLNRDLEAKYGPEKLAGILMEDLCDNTDIDYEVLDTVYFNYGLRGIECVQRHEHAYSPTRMDAAIIVAILHDLFRSI